MQEHIVHAPAPSSIRRKTGRNYSCMTGGYLIRPYGCASGELCPIGSRMGAVHPTLARHGAMWASTPTNNRLLRLDLHRDAVDLHALLGANEDVLGAAQDAGLHQISLVRRHLNFHVRREQLEALGIHEVAGV